MNSTRRSFFRSLALIAGATSLSPTIFIPKFEPVKWKRIPLRLTPNPKWEPFDYELMFFGGQAAWLRCLDREPEEPNRWPHLNGGERLVLNMEDLL